MKADLVLDDPALSPAQKTLFARTIGRPDYHPTLADKLAFKGRALRQRLHNVRTVGIQGARAIARLH
jgi:hypothetical protein